MESLTTPISVTSDNGGMMTFLAAIATDIIVTAEMIRTGTIFSSAVVGLRSPEFSTFIEPSFPHPTLNRPESI
jgi:hypothetical protein